VLASSAGSGFVRTNVGNLDQKNIETEQCLKVRRAFKRSLAIRFGLVWLRGDGVRGRFNLARGARQNLQGGYDQARPETALRSLLIPKTELKLTHERDG